MGKGDTHIRDLSHYSVKDFDLDNFSRIRARHDHLNERLKNFNDIRQIFRHGMSLHGFIFHAIVQITETLMNKTDQLLTI